MSLRQALETIHNSGYTSLPIINEAGEYINSISEGDFLRYIKNHEEFKLSEAENIPLRGVPIKKEIKPIDIYRNMIELIDVAVTQNFVPVIDDLKRFIGIITRKAILNYFKLKASS
jgi:predicted transcriptional regulator